MRKLTNKQIEKRAIMVIIEYFEPLIDEVIKQSEIELETLNAFKKTQGVYLKVRIDDECVKKAIKNINSKSHSFSSAKTGGILEKKDKIIDKHSPEENVFTEVE